MKAREQGGVVDERLNVYGVRNLKVAGNYLSYFFFFLTSNELHIDINLTLLFRLQYNTGQCRS